MTHVISLGGSVYLNGYKPNLDYIYLLELFFRKYTHDKFLIVVGGGQPARDGVTRLKERGITDNKRLDEYGIQITHSNAEDLADILNFDFSRYTDVKLAEYAPLPYNSPDEINSLFEQYKVITTGGTTPGHTTDFVAVEYCYRLGEKEIINIGSADSIYDRVPNLDRERARLLSVINASELLKIWGIKPHEPGLVLPFEPQAIELALQKGIFVYHIGPDIRYLEAVLFNPNKLKLISNGDIKGTLIIPA